MSKDKGAAVPPPLEFDDAGWDGAEIAAGEVMQTCWDAIFGKAEAEFKHIDAQREAADLAVNASVEAALIAVDMLYVERDDNAVTSTSKANASWAVEPLPETCTMDSWLRAAIPETESVSPPSYAMDQFLRQPSTSRPGNNTTSRRTTPQQSIREARSPPRPRAARPAKAQLGPEARAAESRLREELAIRKGQEEKASGRSMGRHAFVGRASACACAWPNMHCLELVTHRCGCAYHMSQSWSSTLYGRPKTITSSTCIATHVSLPSPACLPEPCCRSAHLNA